MTTEEFDNTNNRSLSASSSELLYKFLQTQNFEVYAALSQISKLSHTMFSKGDSWIQVPNLNVTFGQWDLAFLAKSLLLYATQNGSASLMGIPFAQCLKLINDIPDPITGQPREVQNRTFSALFRIGYNQFTWQEDLRYWIARTLYLFDIIPTEDFAHEPFDVIQRFLFMSGLTPRDFITVGFSVWAASTHMNLDYFSPKVFPMGSNFSGTKYGKLPNYLTHRNVQSFLEDVSIDREAFEQKSVQTHLEMDSAFDRYQWNPLYSQPLIRIPGGESLLTTSYVLPIPVLLLERITNGIYWDLMNQELGDQDQAFARLFGSIFENYVGRLLKYHFGNDSVIPEIQIGNRSCDWILVEGDSAVLLKQNHYLR